MIDKSRPRPEARSVDPAAQELLRIVPNEVDITWDRLEAQQPQCGFGIAGICCRNCFMGPCRIDPFGEGAQEGICGADADIIVARNLLRHICAGVSAHSDHGRNVVHALKLAAESDASVYKIRGRQKLLRLAQEYGIPTDNRSERQIAADLADLLLREFGKQEGTLLNLKRAPEKQRKIWQALGTMPRSIDREVVTGMHMTNMGVDSEPEHILLAAARVALADGWGGSMIATDVSDILFGEPEPLRSRANLGVLKEDEVNIVVHGHEPTLSDVIVAAAQDPELLEYARQKGAKGINLAGICCTANEILMRHGVPIAGNFLHQELAILTGVVDLMLVDVQCIFPALAELQQCFHTKVVATSVNAKIEGAEYVPFREEEAYEAAKKIVRIAIDNFPNRKKELINIPQHQQGMIAGFTTEVVYRILGGRYRPSYRPLNDGVMAGRIRGVAGVVGCNNPKYPQDKNHLEMVKELIRNDVLVVQTGCSAIACGKAGLLTPEAAKKYAGKGLQEICEAVGIPPVLHVGSCVDNSRILTACAAMVAEGGIGDSFDKLPVAGAAPEWMSEKAIAIGMYFVASGIFVVINQPLPVTGSKLVTDLLTRKFEEHFGATWAFEPDPIKAAHLMIDRIDRKRAELGLPGPMYEVPYKPKVTAEGPSVHASATVESAAGSGPTISCPQGSQPTPDE